MRKGVFADDPEGESRCVGGPSLREEERSGRDDTGRVFVRSFVNLARGFTGLMFDSGR